MSSFPHLSWDNQTAETQALGRAVKCHSMRSSCPCGFPGLSSPRRKRLLRFPQLAHGGHSGLLPSPGRAVRHPGKPFLKSWGPRWSRKPMSETTLSLLRTGQEWLEDSSFTKFERIWMLAGFGKH